MASESTAPGGSPLNGGLPGSCRGASEAPRPTGGFEENEERRECGRPQEPRSCRRGRRAYVACVLARAVRWNPVPGGMARSARARLLRERLLRYVAACVVYPHEMGLGSAAR